MDLFWVMLGFFIFITLVFVVLAVAFPEWFGITGKKALEIQKHQRGDTEEASGPTDPKNS
jgi:hypothetical protein